MRPGFAIVTQDRAALPIVDNEMRRPNAAAAQAQARARASGRMGVCVGTREADVAC